MTKLHHYAILYSKLARLPNYLRDLKVQRVQMKIPSCAEK